MFFVAKGLLEAQTSNRCHMRATLTAVAVAVPAVVPVGHRSPPVHQVHCCSMLHHVRPRSTHVDGCTLGISGGITGTPWWKSLGTKISKASTRCALTSVPRYDCCLRFLDSSILLHSLSLSCLEKLNRLRINCNVSPAAMYEPSVNLPPQPPRGCSCQLVSLMHWNFQW